MNPASVLAFSARGEAVGAALHSAFVRIGSSSAEYPATIPEPRRETLAYEGGSADEGELVVRILVDTLPTPPAEQQLLQWRRPDEESWRSPKWRIIAVRRSNIDVAWHIRCIPAR